MTGAHNGPTTGPSGRPRDERPAGPPSTTTPRPIVTHRAILAVDPGPVRSALVVLAGATIQERWLVENADLRRTLDRLGWLYRVRADAVLVIEQVASYGMPVGREVFDTVFWSGRFAQTWDDHGLTWTRLPRLDVKLALCHSARANDATIRQALLDRYGGKAAAIGTKHSPGPLYGIKADLWAALALAVAYQDLHPSSAGAAA